MNYTDFEECLHSGKYEGFVKMKEGVKEELEDFSSQGLSHIKVEEELEIGAGKTEDGDMSDSTVEPSEAVDPLAYSGDCYFSCHYCGFSTPASNVLNEHILNRREDQCPISCYQCTFSCSDLSILTFHLQSWHGEEGPSSSAYLSLASGHSSDLINLSIQTSLSTDRPHYFEECNNKTCQREKRIRTQVKAEKLKDYAQSGMRRPFDEKLAGPCLSALPPETADKLALHPNLMRHFEERSITVPCLEQIPKSGGAQMSQITVNEVTASSEPKKYQRTESLTQRCYACDGCQAEFTKLSHLKTHQRIHTKEKPYACDVCQARFSRPGHLKQHQSTHTKEKPFACDVCQARFTQLGGLKIHKRIHTKEKPYACDVCTAKFPRSDHLKQHQRTHTKEKPYACDVCQARFTVPCNLKTHKRIHSKEKPYACNICQARFTQLSHLRKHQKTLHE